MTPGGSREPASRMAGQARGSPTRAPPLNDSDPSPPSTRSTLRNPLAGSFTPPGPPARRRAATVGGSGGGGGAGRRRGEAAAAASGRAEATAGSGRDHVRLRDPRPGGSPDDERPDRGRQPRQDRTGGDAKRPVRGAGERVRRGLPR